MEHLPCCWWTCSHLRSAIKWGGGFSVFSTFALAVYISGAYSFYPPPHILRGPARHWNYGNVQEGYRRETDECEQRDNVNIVHIHWHQVERDLEKVRIPLVSMESASFPLRGYLSEHSCWLCFTCEMVWVVLKATQKRPSWALFGNWQVLICSSLLWDHIEEAKVTHLPCNLTDNVAFSYSDTQFRHLTILEKASQN